MSLPEPVRKQIDDLVRAHRVVLFMKGSRHFPQCGFSATVVGILDEYIGAYETVNVLGSPEMRDGIKVYSDWPTIPQLYVDGKFVGGCDIVREMHSEGDLAKLLGAEPKKKPAAAPPAVTLTDVARREILAAAEEAGADPLRVEVGPRFEHDLYFDARKPDDLVVETGGVTLLFDPDSAARAGGMHIDFLAGKGFKIENPNRPAAAAAAPARVGAMSVTELEAMLAAKEQLLLIDVRTDAEREIAAIVAARKLDEALMEELEELPRETRIVVHCHHGVRSRAAAEQLAGAGFLRVFNLEGGIDAWSQQVDPSIPRY